MILSVVTALRKGDLPAIIEPCKTVVEHLVVSEGTAVQAVNIGLSKATGDVVSFVASDDTLSAIDEAMDALEYFDQVDAVYGDTMIVENGKMSLYSNPDQFNLRTHLSFSCCSTNGFFIRRDVLKEIGGFDEEMKSAADYDFLVRLVKAGLTFKKLDLITYTWRKKGDSASMIGQRDSGLVKAKHSDFARPLISYGGLSYFTRRAVEGKFQIQSILDRRKWSQI